MIATAKSWRDLYAVHPAAAFMPMMSDDELDELAKDIEANGLRQPLVFDSMGNAAQLVDGRNRAEALERLGRKLPWPGRSPVTRASWLKPHEDPVAYVMSANVRRRHLTREQKRDVIAELLKLAPERSDRQVAKDVGVDHKTVGNVRRQGEATGEIPQSTERVGADGKTRMHVVRAPYAVEAERAAIAEADRTLNELAEQQRDLADVDRRLTRAEAEVERREAADNDIPTPRSSTTRCRSPWRRRGRGS
jgi:hypothetical protein